MESDLSTKFQKTVSISDPQFNNIPTKLQPKDYLGIEQQPKMKEIINNEKVLFSDKIKKINMFGIIQERIFIITADRIYNIKKNKLQRVINTYKLDGISKLLQQNKNEFTIHIKSEYDYRFIQDRKDEIIEILKKRYLELHNKNLPIFGISKQNLKDFTTTENDMKKGYSKFPPINLRLMDEDLIKSEKASFQPQEEDDNIQDKFDLRNKQFEAGKNFMDGNEEKFDFEQEQERETISKGGNLVFARQKDQARLQDFVVRKMIGKGTFGKVYMVEYVKTKEIYAMKCIRKDMIIDTDQFENIKLEKDILYNIEHPFIVSMDYVFQNEYRIYFVMKFIKGGELFRHLVQNKRFKEEQARFFFIQIALAIDHLHKNNIIYRDLKPENVLFNEDGYLLLADFGLAKMIKNDELTNSFCGTAEYLAPEMLIGSGHDKTIDWWTMGILLYEMLVGIPPFFHRNKHRMYFLIKEAPVTFPDPQKHGIEVKSQAQDLIKKLLDKNKKTRLGTQGGIDEILKHPFFEGIDINKIVKKEIEPPYKPVIGDDLKFFDQKLVTKDEIQESVIDQKNIKMIQQNQHIFEKF